MIRFFVKRLPTKFSLCHLLSVDQQLLSAGNRWMSWAWLTGLISSNFYKIALWYFYYTCKDTARDRYLLFSTFCWRSCPVSPWCYSVYDITCDWTTSAPTGSLLEPGMWYRIEISTSLWQYLYNLSPDSAGISYWLVYSPASLSSVYCLLKLPWCIQLRVMANRPIIHFNKTDWSWYSHSDEQVLKYLGSGIEYCNYLAQSIMFCAGRVLFQNSFYINHLN